MLYGLALANQWRVSVLVDEAHNMVPRARSMFTGSLDRQTVRAARALAPALVKKELGRVARAWPDVDKEASAPYQVLPAVPDKLLTALQGAISAVTNHLAEQPGLLDPELQRFYFDALQFTRLAESYGDHSLCDLARNSRGDASICIRNVVPAPFLKSRFALAHSSTLFSATLSPWHYYSDLLGLPENTVWNEVGSPFSADQLAVRVAGHISTRYQHRAASLDPIVQLIADQYRARPGNYLAFFSSFDYLEQAAALFGQRHPGIPLWQQARRMNELERDGFLGRFTEDGRGIGFAVLGGAFGEGIDLPGDRLIGAFVATLGLPQVNPVNEQLRERMQALFGAGYDYTYLYPGLQKVVQAAGRVIRTVADRGVVVLIDDRFGQPAVRELLPPWWRIGASEPGRAPSGSHCG
jgi:Rad3-related DNA helicase